jgi:hypothetical protein
MNRNKAKLITAAGVLCLMTAIVLIVVNLIGQVDFPIVIAPALFVGGIILVILSLAYYTER